MRMKPITRQIYNTLLANDFQGSLIYEITHYNHTIKVQLEIPYHQELSNLIDLLPNLQQELKATDVKIDRAKGKLITILFGMRNIDNVPFHPNYIHMNTLLIELPNSFDSSFLDFADGASCHMLNGGAPRMGKTMFLLYLSTILYIQTNQQIELHITSPKAKDFYPLFDLPNVTISTDEEEFEQTLDNLIIEYKARNQLLYSPAFKKATDAKTVKEFYPNQYHLFKPIFLIIDEYARFADFRSIQKKVAELVQTAGYVNVHVIIATQRPDARNTLPANIKMGLMARICFKTADKNNSIVILDEEGAELLPNTKGRAILKDGEMNTVQVPKLTYDQCEELLLPYKKETVQHESTNNNKEESRHINNVVSSNVQNLFSQSPNPTSIQQQQQSDQCLQQSNETIINGWFLLASETDKR